MKVIRNVHLSTGYFDTWKLTFAEVQYESLTMSYLDDLIVVTQLLVSHKIMFMKFQLFLLIHAIAYMLYQK